MPCIRSQVGSSSAGDLGVLQLAVAIAQASRATGEGCAGWQAGWLVATDAYMHRHTLQAFNCTSLARSTVPRGGPRRRRAQQARRHAAPVGHAAKELNQKPWTLSRPAGPRRRRRPERARRHAAPVGHLPPPGLGLGRPPRVLLGPLGDRLGPLQAIHGRLLRRPGAGGPFRSQRPPGAWCGEGWRGVFIGPGLMVLSAAAA